MNDDYLQDPRSEPDEEIVALEKVLSRRRYRPIPLASNAPKRRGFFSLAAAAAVVLAASATLYISQMKTDSDAAPTGDSDPASMGNDVERSEKTSDNAPREPYLVEGLTGVLAAAAGDSLDIPDGVEARFVIAKLGDVVVKGAARIAVLETGPRVHRLRLEHGRVDASIFAPARTFMIDTPSGNTVDLGCRYEITVAQNGDTSVEVKLGTIAFERDGRSVLLPKGTICAGRRTEGPGIPYWTDADESLVRFVKNIEFKVSAETDSLAAPSSGIKRRDSLTFCHLLEHSDPSVRRSAFDSLVRMDLLPDGFLTKAHTELDRQALDALRDELRYFWY